MAFLRAQGYGTSVVAKAEIESEIVTARESWVEMAGAADDSLGDVRERDFAHSLPSGPDLLESELVVPLEVCNAFRLQMADWEAFCPLGRPFLTLMTWVARP